MTAVLCAWGATELDDLGTQVLPAILSLRERVQGELETSFADNERLPGFLVDADAPDMLTVSELLHVYGHLPSEVRMHERALVGLRCIVLLLFAFDSRMRKFMWGDHDLHAILGTHHFDHVKSIRQTACVFTDRLKEKAGVFVANIIVARKEDDPDIIADLASEFLDFAQRSWTFGGEDLPWAPGD